MIREGSLSFKGHELDNIFYFTPKADVKNNFFDTKPASTKDKDCLDNLSRSNSNSSQSNLLLPEPESQRDRAALKLQKVYRSFRTRRQLADCAVLAEQRWWKVLDFAELKRSSISFFDIERTESALSRWSRARKRAAKVGKGLSKDEKARKLALQHWLEAIDPRHRYGHNLQFYYVKWLHCDSNQPFFYWLDIGEGKEISHERCSRSKLQQQCIKYLGPVEREAYEAVVESGRLLYKQSGKCVETTGDAKWIFVLSTSKTLYVGQKIKGTFQHSSFLAGGATLSAGRLVVEDGVLKAVWPHSGHYLPTEENFLVFMSFLKEHHVDLTEVKRSPSDDEDEDVLKMKKDQAELPHNMSSQETHNTKSNHHGGSSRLSRRVGPKIARLEIPKRDEVCAILEEQEHFQTPDNSFSEDGYETAEESFIDEEEFMVVKSNLFEDDEAEGENENKVPKEKIMKRIDSHKGLKSFQLAHQLGNRWTTGVGPRIGCMRDYPSELQFRILEDQHLSPSSKIHMHHQKRR